MKFAPFTYEDTVKKVITVRDIYGSDAPEIPEGWEPTGEFRPSKEGENHLHPYRCASFLSIRDDVQTAPRITLRKVKNYSDTEILDFVMKWLYFDVAYSGVTTKNGQYDNNPGPIYRQLVTSSFTADNHKELREVISAEMRKKGK